MIPLLVRRRPFTVISRAVASASRFGPFRFFASGSDKRARELAHKNEVIAMINAAAVEKGKATADIIAGLTRELGHKDEIIRLKDEIIAQSIAGYKRELGHKDEIIAANNVAAAAAAAHWAELTAAKVRSGCFFKAAVLRCF